MMQDSEDQLVLRLTVEHLLATADWPTLRDLHRRIHQDLYEDVDVRAVARRLSPHPFHSGYSDLGQRFVPPLKRLDDFEKGKGLLDAVLSFVRLAKGRYRSSAGSTEITDAQLKDALDLDEPTTRAIPRLLDGVPYVTSGWSMGEWGWKITISDDIVRWHDVHTVQEVLDFLGSEEGKRQQELTAMAQSKYEFIRATTRGSAVAIAETPATQWYESSAAKGIAWTVGIIAAVSAIALSLSQLFG